jgi:hypothetical protein
MKSGTAMMAAATAINVAYAVINKSDVFPILIASGALLLATTAMQDIAPGPLSGAFAGTFLVGTILYHGMPIINALTQSLASPASVGTSTKGTIQNV